MFLTINYSNIFDTFELYFAHKSDKLGWDKKKSDTFFVNLKMLKYFIVFDNELCEHC